MKNTKKSTSSDVPHLANDDKEMINDLYDFMCREGLVDLELGKNGSKIVIRRHRNNFSPQSVVHEVNHSMITPHPSQVQTESHDKPDNSSSISSPLIGVFYRSASPTAEPYAKEGEKISAGAVLCIVEAMKVMNEIRAEKNCRIKKILVENGNTVAANQPLFQVEWI